MGNPRGVKRDFVALEKRRMQAARMYKKGETQAAIAKKLGVSRQSVSRWCQSLEEAGRTGLKKAGRAGRKPKLTSAELMVLQERLQHGPEALGYSTSLWTTGRVTDLIHEISGIRFHVGHVWKILRQLGWSCQRPKSQALERDEAAIRNWKRRRWPTLKKTPESGAKP
jgi:transposase